MTSTSSPAAKPAGRQKQAAAKVGVKVERTGNPLSKELGKAIKTLRIKHDLSQEQLAVDAGVDRTFLSRMERGVGNPSLLTLSTVCYAFDISLSELLSDIGKELNVPPRSEKSGLPNRRINQAAPVPRVSAPRRLR